MHRYKDLQKIPLKHSIKLFTEMVKKQQKQDLWRLWCSTYPHYTKEDYESWEDFYAKQTKPPLSATDGDLIIARANAILKRQVK